jgi:hypothetical protein
MFVRWKDVPPKATYYYDIAVKGGAPAFDEKRSSSLSPIDAFPPAPYKSGPGSSAFVMDVPWPYRNGGSFEIQGTLYALPPQYYSGEAWRQQTPLAKYPFEERFELHNRCHYAKGTVSLSNDAMVYVQVLLAYVQKGRRPVMVTAGGKTIYDLLDNNYYNGGYFPDRPSDSHWVNVRLPFGTPAPSEATVSFVDFGTRVTETVPLEWERPTPDLSGRAARLAEAEAKSLQKIQSLMRNPQLSQGTIDQIRREYHDLWGLFETADCTKWKQYATLCLEYGEKYYQMDLAAARGDDRKGQLREILASLDDTLYWDAVNWGNTADAMSAFQQMVSRIQGSGMDAGKVNGKLCSLYEQHAGNVARLTGDLGQARRLWQQAQEFRKHATGISTYRDNELQCPYDIDDSFK